MTSITSLKTITTPDYTYEFYPNINLCVYKKSNNVDSRTVALGTFPTTDDVRRYQISWANIIHTNKLDREVQGNLINTITQVTGWTSSAFSLVSGFKSTYSEGVFRIAFSSSSLRFV